LGSRAHFSAVESKLEGLMTSTSAPGDQPMQVAEFLRDRAVHALHTELGFDVEQLASHAPALEEKRRAAQRFRTQISCLPAVVEWLCVDRRWNLAWDQREPQQGRHGSSIWRAPDLDMMRSRCCLDEGPPLLREVQLPARVPPPEQAFWCVQAGKHRFPFEPSSRLAVAALLESGQAPEDFDLICATSLLKALTGDPSRCADTFYLQRYGRAICAVHVPSTFHSFDTPGHMVEALLCEPQQRAEPKCYYCVSQVRIGERRVCYTSEVDARDDSGRLVEIKTSSNAAKGHMSSSKVALQVLLNGSSSVLSCSLDSSKSVVQAMEKLPVDEILERHRDSITAAGQRVTLLLERLCCHELLSDSCSAAGGSPLVIKMTFDEIGEPVLTPAPLDVGVLPLGMPPC